MLLRKFSIRMKLMYKLSLAFAVCKNTMSNKH